MGRPSLPHEQIFGYVGEGAPMLLQRAMGEGTSGDECRRALEFFLAYYRAHMLDNTVTYPGVREGLEQLAGLSMAVLTNKPVRISRAILEGLGLAPYFRYIYGGNSFERKKPDPMGTEVLLRDFGMAPREAMIVGDSEIDVQTARNANTWACGVTSGWAAHAWLIFPQTSSWTASPSCPPTSIINSLAATDLSPDFSQGVKEEVGIFLGWGSEFRRGNGKALLHCCVRS